MSLTESQVREISNAVMIETKKSVPHILSTSASVLIPVLTQDECKKIIPQLVQSALIKNSTTVKVINKIVDNLMVENERQIRKLVEDPAKHYVTPLLNEMKSKYNKELTEIKVNHTRELEKIKIQYNKDVTLATRIAVLALIAGLASLGFLLFKH